jgi:hypothetical protein
MPEWIVGLAALALAIDVYLTHWYGSADAWSALSVLRYGIVVCAVGGLAVFCAQGLCRGPAVPICTTAIEFLVAGVVGIALVYRVLIDPPGSQPVRSGAYIGLVLCAAVALGAYRSMRLDGIRDADGPGEIELRSLPQPD